MTGAGVVKRNAGRCILVTYVRKVDTTIGFNVEVSAVVEVECVHVDDGGMAPM